MVRHGSPGDIVLREMAAMAAMRQNDDQGEQPAPCSSRRHEIERTHQAAADDRARDRGDVEHRTIPRHARGKQFAWESDCGSIACREGLPSAQPTAPMASIR